MTKATEKEIALRAALKDSAENLVIGVGMGWDLDGIVERLKADIAAWEAEQPSNTPSNGLPTDGGFAGLPEANYPK